MYNEMSVTLISVSHDTVVNNKHEEQIRHYYVNFQQDTCTKTKRSSASSWQEEGDQDDEVVWGKITIHLYCAHLISPR